MEKKSVELAIDALNSKIKTEKQLLRWTNNVDSRVARIQELETALKDFEEFAKPIIIASVED